MTLRDDQNFGCADRPRLIGISGSLRRGSTSTRLLREAARAFGPCEFSLGSIRLPLYDADLENAHGLPIEVRRLADQIGEAEAVLIATPDYGKSVSGVLKNALDWLSRTRPAPLAGKPVAILSSSEDHSGGGCAQLALRNALTCFQPRVLQGPEVALPGGEAAFDADGRLRDAVRYGTLLTLMARLRTEVALVRA